jgi:hypothetical protein
MSESRQMMTAYRQLNEVAGRVQRTLVPYLVGHLSPPYAPLP